MKLKNEKSIVKQQWFWPLIYTLVALLIVAFVLVYNTYVNVDDDVEVVGEDPVISEEQPIETSVQQESMRYPFDEMYVDRATIVQDFYDAQADAADQQDALFVFNNTYTTSNGISIAIDEEPFQVLAALSGVVESVEVDAFVGNTVTLTHENGFVTKYSSLSDVVVEEGDEVLQGNPLGTAVANESNPEAGVHLHFQVLQNGAYINPRSLLAF